MRLLHNILFLIFISQASYTLSSNTLTPKKQLMRFYRAEFNRLAGKICDKLMAISEQILNDDIVRYSTESAIQKFQQNLTHFQNIHPYYVRFGLNESLATAFSNMVQDFYLPKPLYGKEAVFIKQLLKNSGYDALRQQYKIELKDFFLNKFSNKYEQLKQQITSRSQLYKFQQRFSKCIEKAQECGSYECLLTNFRHSTLKLKDKFIGNIQRHMLDLFISVLSDIKHFYVNVLKHPKFGRLTPSLRRDVVKMHQLSNANYVIIDNIYVIFHLGAWDPLQDFISNHSTELTPEQQQRLTDIFEDCGYRKPEENFVNNFAEFIETDFINEVEDFKVAFRQEGCEEDVALMDKLNSTSSSSSKKEKVLAFRSLNILEMSQLMKWRL